MSLQCWSSAAYAIPLPEGHRFPIAKYALLRDRVLADGIIGLQDMHAPERASSEALLAVHGTEYVSAFTAGTLEAGAMRRIGFPWSPELVERAYRAVGGTMEAAAAALDRGVAMNLAGGTHHAFANHGEGFCVFNDVVVAIKHLQRQRLIERALIIDLDVHQGNGTNALCASDSSIVTFDVHGRRNFPFTKVPASFEIELEDGTGDEEYLTRLSSALPSVLAGARADIAVYLAGADPHHGDRLGRLRLTSDGLARRDEIVLDMCRAMGLPVAITIAGGYGHDVHETVAIHARTAAIASRYAVRPRTGET